jgi:WD40 repeat protein
VSGWESFSHDGRYFCFATKNNRSFQLWALDPVPKVLEVPFQGDVKIRPDGRRLAASTGTGTIRFYDLPSGQPVNELTVGKGMIGLYYHPSGHQLAVCDWGSDTFRLLDADSGNVVHTLAHPERMSFPSWGPDGKILAVLCADRNIYLWDARTGKRLAVLQGDQHAPAWGPDGKILAVPTEDRNIYLWDARTGKRLAALQGQQSTPIGCAFNHGGDLLASYGYDGATQGQRILRL